MKAEAIPKVNESTIICMQAGNVNTGAFDPAEAICDLAHRSHAWVHVDGAFGLWAKASGRRKALAAGVEKADSWATDAHKWLNTPYDSGLAFVKDGKSLRAAMAQSAAYLIQNGTKDPSAYVPEMSRRARGIEIWAALRSLGRNGLAEMIDKSCDLTLVFADKLRKAGFKILNDVVLNQILVSFENPILAERIIKGIQEDGTCWCGGTTWKNQPAMRISVSSWRTSLEDIDRCAAAIIKIADFETLKFNDM